MGPGTTLLADRRGASLLEYLILVGLLALPALGAARHFGVEALRTAEGQAACIAAFADCAEQPTTAPVQLGPGPRRASAPWRLPDWDWVTGGESVAYKRSTLEAAASTQAAPAPLTPVASTVTLAAPVLAFASTGGGYPSAALQTYDADSCTGSNGNGTPAGPVPLEAGSGGATDSPAATSRATGLPPSDAEAVTASMVDDILDQRLDVRTETVSPFGVVDPYDWDLEAAELERFRQEVVVPALTHPLNVVENWDGSTWYLGYVNGRFVTVVIQDGRVTHVLLPSDYDVAAELCAAGDADACAIEQAMLDAAAAEEQLLVDVGMLALSLTPGVGWVADAADIVASCGADATSIDCGTAVLALVPGVPGAGRVDETLQAARSVRRTGRAFDSAGEAAAAAAALGCTKTTRRSHAWPIFDCGDYLLTPDADGHNGGVWKKLDKRTGKRICTTDAGGKTCIKC
ncbi:MAG: toxin C-terminal domain-containing protein [Polyangiaceae bacterium]